jgi:hypothetical protein
VRATILGWSTASGLVLGFIAGVLVFAVMTVGPELLSGAIPRLAGRVRTLTLLFSFVLLPAAGALLGWLEGRLKLQ